MTGAIGAGCQAVRYLAGVRGLSLLQKLRLLPFRLAAVLGAPAARQQAGARQWPTAWRALAQATARAGGWPPLRQRLRAVRPLAAAAGWLRDP